MQPGWNVILRYDQDFNGTSLWIAKQLLDGGIDIVQPINLTITRRMGQMEQFPEPTMRFTGTDANQFLQSLADGLARTGFKPTESSTPQKEIDAIKAHLEDMRKLVFDALLPPAIPPPYLERRES